MIEEKKCHNCGGSGKVNPVDPKTKKPCNRVGTCYYCNGKGYRTSSYGRDC